MSVYGAWLASGNLMAMIGLFGGGFAGVITQKMAEAISRGEKQHFLELAGANIMTAAIIAVLIFSTAMIVSSFVPSIVNIEMEYAFDIQTAFQVSALATSLAVFVSLFGAFPQVWQETRQVGIINVFVNILGILATVVTLLLGFGVVSLPLGYLVRAVMNLLLQGVWIISYWKKNEPRSPIFKWSTIPYILKENALPFAANIGGVLVNHSQSLIIASFMTPALAAIFDITGKVAMCLFNFLAMAKGSFFALLSLTFGKGDTTESSRVSNTIIQYYSIFMTAIIVYSVLFSKTIIHYWVGLDKFGGDWLLLVIVLSMAVTQYRGMLNDFLFSGGQIARSAKYDIASMCIYMVILFATIHFINAYSIPVSMFVTNILFVFLYLLQIKKYLRLNINKMRQHMLYNAIITLPFMIAYFVMPLDCTNIVLQSFVFVLTTMLLLMLLGFVNKSAYVLLRNKLIYKHYDSYNCFRKRMRP